MEKRLILGSRLSAWIYDFNIKLRYVERPYFSIWPVVAYSGHHICTSSNSSDVRPIFLAMALVSSLFVSWKSLFIVSLSSVLSLQTWTMALHFNFRCKMREKPWSWFISRLFHYFSCRSGCVSTLLNIFFSWFWVGQVSIKPTQKC